MIDKIIDKMGDKIPKSVKRCKRCGQMPEIKKWRNARYYIKCNECMVTTRCTDSIEEAAEIWNKYN